MVKEISFLHEISPIKITWKIKVRIICLHCKPKNSNPPSIGYINMIVMDEAVTYFYLLFFFLWILIEKKNANKHVFVTLQGNKIIAQLKRVSTSKFEQKFSEGSVVLITYFTVLENTTHKYLLPHRYKILLTRSTRFKKCYQFLGNLHGFTFTNFKDILSTKRDLRFSIGKLNIL